MFRSFMWAIFRLRFLTYRLVIEDVWGHLGGRRGGETGTRSRCLAQNVYINKTRENSLLTTRGHGTHY